MTTSALIKAPDPNQDKYSMNVLGFWVYLMTDCLLFGTLFSTYAILHHSTFGGPGAKELFDLKTVIAETAVLLVSSAACGLGVIASIKGKKGQMFLWLIAAFLLGASFVTMELHEFSGIVREGYSWKTSAFLTSFFTLVGTHGLHVSIGLFWLLILLLQLVFLGVTTHTFRRLVIFSMFWHFLDLVWIFIFTFVYLLGVA